MCVHFKGRPYGREKKTNGIEPINRAIRCSTLTKNTVRSYTTEFESHLGGHDGPPRDSLITRVVNIVVFYFHFYNPLHGLHSLHIILLNTSSSSSLNENFSNFILVGCYHRSLVIIFFFLFHPSLLLLLLLLRLVVVALSVRRPQCQVISQQLHD